MDRDDTDERAHTPDKRSHSERRRDADGAPTGMVSVRLVRKYADMIDGVNLEHTSVGDQLHLTRRDADILIAEGWAVADVDRRAGSASQRSLANDRPRVPERKSKTKR